MHAALEQLTRAVGASLQGGVRVSRRVVREPAEPLGGAMLDEQTEQNESWLCGWVFRNAFNESKTIIALQADAIDAYKASESRLIGVLRAHRGNTATDVVTRGKAIDDYGTAVAGTARAVDTLIAALPQERDTERTAVWLKLLFGPLAALATTPAVTSLPWMAATHGPQAIIAGCILVLLASATTVWEAVEQVVARRNQIVRTNRLALDRLKAEFKARAFAVRDTLRRAARARVRSARLRRRQPARKSGPHQREACPPRLRPEAHFQGVDQGRPPSMAGPASDQGRQPADDQVAV